MRLSDRWRDLGLLGELGGGVSVEIVASRSGFTEVARSGQGEPLVLLPGLAGGWRLLTPLIDSLSKRHQVIAIGFAGDSGYSELAASQTPRAHADAVANVIHALGLERPAVMGVSFGGAVALELALRHARHVSRLAVMGVEAQFHTTPAAGVVRSILERCPLPTDSIFVNQFFNILHGRAPVGETEALARFVVRRCWDTDQGVIAGRLRALDQFDVGEQLWQIDIPTLVMAGTRDVIIPADRQRAVAEPIAGAQFEPIFGAGHVAFLTHQEEVVRLVTRWIRRRVRAVR